MGSGLSAGADPDHADAERRIRAAAREHGVDVEFWSGRQMREAGFDGFNGAARRGRAFVDLGQRAAWAGPSDWVEYVIAHEIVGHAARGLGHEPCSVDGVCPSMCQHVGLLSCAPHGSPPADALAHLPWVHPKLYLSSERGARRVADGPGAIMRRLCVAASCGDDPRLPLRDKDPLPANTGRLLYEAVGELARMLDAPGGAPVVVHCRMGHNRAAAVAAAYAVLVAGRDAPSAVKYVRARNRESRGQPALYNRALERVVLGLQKNGA